MLFLRYLFQRRQIVGFINLLSLIFKSNFEFLILMKNTIAMFALLKDNANIKIEHENYINHNHTKVIEIDINRVFQDIFKIRQKNTQSHTDRTGSFIRNLNNFMFT